ncbi:MAG: T9SS type A sorting domain-containing protein [Bacteroidales bacterium]|nr:T9SS type A sorting domain-containing protein [Bacteroidales bacterium]
MKKVLSIIIMSLLCSFLYAGVSPKVLKFPSVTYGKLASFGDSIWIQNTRMSVELWSVKNNIKLAEYSDNELFKEYFEKMEVDKQGNLWIATMYDGILYFDGELWNTFNLTDGIPSMNVNDFFFETDTVWIATTGGLGYYSGAKWQTISVNQGLPNNNVTSVLKDSTGKLYVGIDNSTTGGVAIREGNQWTVINKSNNLAANTVADMVFDKHGNLCVALGYGGLSIFKNDTIVNYSKANVLQESNVFSITVDSQNRLWLKQGSNLSVLQHETDSVFYVQSVAIFGTMLSLISIEAIADEIFVSFGGICLAKYNMSNQFSFFNIGIASEKTTALAIDNENSVWVATEFPTLLFKINNEGQITQFQTPISKIYITNIQITANGTVWISTEYSGVFRLENGNWTKFDASTVDLFLSSNVEKLFLDKNDRIWMASDSLLYYYNDSAWVKYEYSSLLYKSTIKDFIIDNSNNVYVGYSDTLGLIKITQSGELTIINSKIENNEYIKTNVLSLVEDKLLIGSCNYGLYSYDNGILEPISLGLDDLNYSEIEVLFSDSENNIFISGTKKPYEFLILDSIERETKLIPAENSVFSPAVSHFREDNNGNIWFTSLTTGLYFLRKPPKVNFVSSDTICLYDKYMAFKETSTETTVLQWVVKDTDTLFVSYAETLEYEFLKAGNFEVSLWVTNGVDSNFITKSVYVKENSDIKIVGKTGLCSGSKNLLISNTTKEEYKYLWSNAATTSYIEAKEIGTYSLTVTNEFGCSKSDSIKLTSLPQPNVKIMSETEGYICKDSKTVLVAETEQGNSLLWSNGASSASILAGEGDYSLIATNTQGCTDTAFIKVQQYTAYNEPLGIVTASEKDEFLIVAWEKTYSKKTISYNVYRQEAGKYDKIGFVPFSASSLFIDKNSNYKKRAYTYKITTVNECGSETELKDAIAHTSMHLITIPLNNEYSLIWTPYIGVEPLSYTVYEVNKDYSLNPVESLPGSNNTTYTLRDYDTTKSYRIGVDLGYEVDSDKLKSDSGPFSQSLSNIAEAQLSTTLYNDLTINAQIFLFPTIATEKVTIAIVGNESSDYTITLSTVEGKFLESIIVKDSKDATESFNVSVLNSGMYSVTIQSENKSAVLKFLKN